MRDFLLEMALAVRDVVRPWIRELRGRDIVGGNVHGDATFGIDAEAERVVADVAHRSRRDLAVYSESTGLRVYGDGTPETLLIVDPVDGTRNATCGFEGCMVSIAAAPFHNDATLGDVDVAVLMDIVAECTFTATRAGELTMTRDGTLVAPAAPRDVASDRLRWSLNTAGRPARLLFPVMADLIDASNLTGSFNSSNSTTFALSRIATGQLDAHMDVADRIYIDIPESAPWFPQVGDGRLTGSQPHDLAAAALVVEAAGGIVSDAWGRSLEHVPLLAEGHAANLSTVAACSREVHEAAIDYLTRHMQVARDIVERG